MTEWFYLRHQTDRSRAIVVGDDGKLYCQAPGGRRAAHWRSETTNTRTVAGEYFYVVGRVGGKVICGGAKQNSELRYGSRAAGPYNQWTMRGQFRAGDTVQFQDIRGGIIQGTDHGTDPMWEVGYGAPNQWFRPDPVPSSGTFALRSHANGMWVCADRSRPDAPLVADRPQAAEWETFRWRVGDDDCFTLQSSNGQYVRVAPGGFNADANETGATRFQWQDALGRPDLGGMWLVGQAGVVATVAGVNLLTAGYEYRPEAMFEAVPR